MSTVSVTIDYSNGAQKHFSSVPWNEGLTILGGIEACAKIPPGITITFGSDRSGHAIGLVIDGIGRGDAEGDWGGLGQRETLCRSSWNRNKLWVPPR